MSAMPAAQDDWSSLIEMDDPPSAKRSQPTPVDAPDERMALLDLVDDVKAPTCLDCHKPAAINDLGTCEACYAVRLATTVPTSTVSASSPVEPMAPDLDFGAAPEELAAADAPLDFAGIASESTANAEIVGAGAADGGGRLPGVGFRTQDGYITAIRNGVKAATHREYMDILRTKYRLSGAALAKLNLPGPMAESALPEGKGITHTPTGPSIFDRPRAQRQFIVAPKAEQISTKVDTALKASEMVAGALAEGHHAIVAWEGTSGMTRGELLAALTAIGRQAWAPKAPNARAQAGTAIAALGKAGYDVKALRKGAEVGSQLVANEHVWTVGRIAHGAAVGDTYGQIVVRFKLAGSVLTFEGASNLAAPAVAEFDRRMAAEQFKSSDLTSWLSRTLRSELDGVRFGALGWIVPAKHVAAAKQLTETVGLAGFGSGWVHGLPVATSDQLRDGIVRGLVDEVTEQLNKLREERSNAKAVRATAYDAVLARGLGADELARAMAELPAGDIGPKRRETYLRELRVVYARVKVYGEVLGERRVDQAERWLKDALVELENLGEADDGVCNERFRLIFEDMAEDAQRAAGGES